MTLNRREDLFTDKLEQLSGQRKKDDSGADITSTVASTFAGLRAPYWG
jgi:hypothetical protein